MMETRTIQQSVENVARTLSISKEQVMSAIEQASPLKNHSTVANTARLAAFLASDGAATITGAIVNATSGTIID
jgi:3-oxoacyl-[acyl-carrier protein] reductase